MLLVPLRFHTVTSGLSHRSYFRSRRRRLFEATWRAAEIFRGYFCRAGHRNASLRIAFPAARACPDVTRDRGYIRENNGTNARSTNPRGTRLENPSSITVAIIRRIHPSAEHAHFSLPSHARPHARTHARTHACTCSSCVSPSRGVATSPYRASELSRVGRSTMRRARTPTAD